MNTDEQTRQALWELVYDLLPEDDASALRERISSEPDLARAYATVKLQSDLLASAAQLDDDSIELQAPNEAGEGPSVAVPSRGSRVRSPRLARQLVGLAAALSIALVGYSLLRLESTVPGDIAVVAAVETKPVRASLTLPGHFHREVDTPFLIETADLSGAPMAAELEFLVYDASGSVALRRSGNTDDKGSARLVLPAGELFEPAVLEVVSASGGEERLATSVAVLASQMVTYLSTDKPFYRPSETVHFRSVTLSRFDLTPVDDAVVDFSIRDADGVLVPGSEETNPTTHGVASGGFEIAPGLKNGKYTLVARCDGAKEARGDFYVQGDYEIPIWRKKVELARDSYGPADQVVVDFEAIKQADGSPASGVRLNYRLFVDGRSVTNEEQAAAATDERGKSRFEFFLPSTIQNGDGFLAITASDGSTRESLAKAIPINLGQVEVEFFAEGGELVADIPNRVYFHARDPAGKPVHLEGRVVDESGANVATVVTEHAGRGRFSISPRSNGAYRLQIQRPSGAASSPALPPVSTSAPLAMQTSAGVFSADNSLEITLHAKQPLGPLVISAACRGAVVGLERVERQDFEAFDGRYTARQRLRVSDESAGIVRITVFDNTDTPAAPLTERLAYCRPIEKIEVSIDGLEPTFETGSRVSLALTTTFEDGNRSGAVLGASVVSSGALALADRQPPQMPTYFYLAAEIERPDALDDAEFYLADGAEAESALDMLLGTQGWRQFAAPNPSQLAEASAPVARGATKADFDSDPPAANEGLLAAIAPVPSQELLPRIVEAELLVEQQATSPASIERFRTPSGLRWVWRALIAGSVVLIALIIVDAGIQRVGHRRVWATLGVVAMLGGLAVLTWLPSTNVEVASRSTRTTSEAAPAADSMSMMGVVVEEADELARDAETDDQSIDAQLSEAALGERVEMPTETASSPQPSSVPGEVQNLGRQLADPTLSDENLKEELARENVPRAVGGQASTTEMERVEASGERKQLEGAARDARLLWRPEPAGPPAVTLSRRYVGGFSLPASPSPSETLLWRPLLITDENGEVTLSFELPASPPATFQLRVDAHARGRLGASQATIVTTTP